MNEIVVEDAEQALVLLEGIYAVPDDAPLDDAQPKLTFGSGFGITVHLLDEYHSEIPAQYLDAYHRQKRAIYQLVALIENGTTDTKTLTSAQLEEYRYSVSVKEGSSVLEDNLKELLSKILVEAIGKMSGTQVVITVLGLAVLAASAYGWRSYLESRKEQRLAELAAGERRDTVASLNAANAAAVARLSGVMEKMLTAGPVGQKAVDVSERAQFVCMCAYCA